MTQALDAFMDDSQTPGVFVRFPQTTRSGSHGQWFQTPVGEVVCFSGAEMAAFFRRLERALAAGYYAAGYLTYECGYALAGVPCPHTDLQTPLAWFGLFNAPQRIAWPRPIPTPFPGPDFWLRPCQPQRTYPQYRKKIQTIQRHIASGDTYQVNATFPLLTRLDGNAGTLFHALFKEQPARYAAFVRGGGRTLLSFSPELFFERRGDRMTTRPMKGTRPRAEDPALDAQMRETLRASAKDRAENVMIVDLLRNDLGRLCHPGSIHVKKMFQIESLPSVHQMTSTVEGRLRLPVRWQEVFASLFPCGSVTGAPKIKTMEIISQIESEPRGVYTGAVGWIAPNGDAQFNVPIRTLEWGSESRSVRLGVGSGIVADSTAGSEWQECLLKAAFVNARGVAREYELIETFYWDPGTGLRREALHMQRLSHSAAALGFVCPLSRIRRLLAQHVQSYMAGSSRRVRLLLSRDGRVTIESTPWRADPAGQALPVVAWARRRTDSHNLFLRHKTTNRAGYDALWHEAREEGLMDVIFCNERRAVTEGAITNVFIRKGKVWLTPPVEAGLLPGVERTWLLQEKKATMVERNFFRRDVIGADEIALANAVRGFFSVRLA